MKRFGLAAIFKFVDKGSRPAARAAKKVGLLGTALKGLRGVGHGVASTMGTLVMGVGRLAAKLGALAGGIGVGSAIKAFANFEGQMGAVKSVLGKEAAPMFDALSSKAKELGETTQFTAVESAAAMENLARAGFDANQIIGAIGPTLNAAAADGLDLATAADIVAANIKAFGLEAKTTEQAIASATRVADTLAYVSAKTNTNMTLLQEGMKFAAPVAKELGVSLEDTAATMGLLADIGLKGTLAGTSFKNALLQISKNAKSGRVKVGQFNAAIATTQDGNVNVSKTMQNVANQIARIPKATDRAKAAMELLGLRGIALPSAFKAALQDTEKMKKLFGDLAENAKGSAEQMAKMRLDNIRGDFVKLKSALEGALINFGGLIGSSLGLRGGIQGITSVLGQLSKAFAFFTDNPQMIDKNGVAIKGVSEKVTSFVQSGIQGFRAFQSWFSRVTVAAQPFMEALGQIWESLKNIIKTVTGTSTAGEGLKVLGNVLGATFAAVSETIKFVSIMIEEMFNLAVKAFNYIKNSITDNAIVDFVKFGHSLVEGAGTLAGKGYVKLFGEEPATRNVQPVKDAKVQSSGLLPVSAGDMVVDRSALAGAVAASRGGLAPSVASTMAGTASPGGQTSPPPVNVDVGGDITIQVPVTIDGRQVALAVARANLSDLERSGATMRPGERSALLQRGFRNQF